jgi:hypothetical protein
MLDDRWRKAVAAVGNFSHRVRLLSASLAGYPGYPDKALGRAVFAGGFTRQGQRSELAACPEREI